jgi:hypothetical protein
MSDDGEYETPDGVGWCLIEVDGRRCGAAVHETVRRSRRTHRMDYYAPPDDVDHSCNDGHKDLIDSEWTDVYFDPDEEATK